MSPIEAAAGISKQVTIRSCNSHNDLKLCVDLQRRIWKFDEEDLVPAALFVVAQHTGGHAYIAFHGEIAIGFALAFSAERGGRRFWHSHIAGILPDHQNQGVGRLLKLHQREEAFRAGIAAIEWTFDPLELRNAHFNIARLGAIVRRYIPNCYGLSTSPLHGTLPTDRLVAEWLLPSRRVNAILAGKNPQRTAGSVAIGVPTIVRGLKDSTALKTQCELRRRLTDLFSRGYAITGFQRGNLECEYLLERYED